MAFQNGHYDRLIDIVNEATTFTKSSQPLHPDYPGKFEFIYTFKWLIDGKPFSVRFISLNKRNSYCIFFRWLDYFKSEVNINEGETWQFTKMLMNNYKIEKLEDAVTDIIKEYLNSPKLP